MNRSDQMLAECIKALAPVFALTFTPKELVMEAGKLCRYALQEGDAIRKERLEVSVN